MPLQRFNPAPADVIDLAPQPRRGGLRRLSAPPEAPPPQESSDSPEWALPALAAGAAVGAGALALKNPALVNKAARTVQDVRIMSMLSGLAVPKSILGNLGGTAYASIERGSLAPLKALLSRQTLSDVGKALKSGTQSGNLEAPATKLAKYNPFGRLMGAFDEATQNALVRSGVMHDPLEVQAGVKKGLTLAEATQKSAKSAAAREVLQAPLPMRLQDALKNPVAQYLVPFRRTPFNQLIEGFKTFDPQTTGQKIALGTSLGTGVATGLAAEDPKTVALGVAASGRYGLPFATGAMLGRYGQTGNKRSAAEVGQGLSPVSDYSLQEGVLGPVTTPFAKVIPKPAAVPAYDYLRSLLGMK